MVLKTIIAKKIFNLKKSKKKRIKLSVEKQKPRKKAQNKKVQKKKQNKNIVIIVHENTTYIVKKFNENNLYFIIVSSISDFGSWIGSRTCGFWLDILICQSTKIIFLQVYLPLEKHFKSFLYDKKKKPTRLT